jgi:hypothetical protein
MRNFKYVTIQETGLISSNLYRWRLEAFNTSNTKSITGVTFVINNNGLQHLRYQQQFQHALNIALTKTVTMT